MANRPLQAVSGIGPEHFTDTVSEAVQGNGPALLPIDADLPFSRMRDLLEAMRPDTLRTPEGVFALDGGIGVAEDTALVIATSGSTGVPKGAELSSAALLHSARASCRRVDAAVEDTWLCVLPTEHISGLQVILRALVNGGRPLHQRFDVESVTAIAARYRPHVSLVPTQLRRLLAADTDLSLFATIFLGGAAADASLLAAAREAGGRITTTYGMSETCGGCVYDGVPLDDMRADLDDEGRILLSGPALFSGYRLDPGLTADYLVSGNDDTAWFRTSDLGRFDEQGLLQVRGRVDDVINTGGHKVIPGEVATLLNQLDSVQETAVVGRPDDDWGHRVTAVVVPTDPATPPALEELRHWVRAWLPAYAAPHEVEIRTEIPLLASGKPDLAALRTIPAVHD